MQEIIVLCTERMMWIMGEAFIVYVLIFSEKALFRHRPFIWEQRLYSILQHLTGNRWRAVTSIHYDHGWEITFYLIIDCFECTAVMFIPWMNAVSENPAMFITA